MPISFKKLTKLFLEADQDTIMRIAADYLPPQLISAAEYEIENKLSPKPACTELENQLKKLNIIRYESNSNPFYAEYRKGAKVKGSKLVGLTTVLLTFGDLEL
jgi:hypothetical protein